MHNECTLQHTLLNYLTLQVITKQNLQKYITVVNSTIKIMKTRKPKSNKLIIMI